MRALFAPNKTVSRTVMLGMITVQGAAFLILWIFWAPAIIPRPAEVLASFGGLWQQGVVYELWVSLKTNLKALALTGVISLSLAYLTVMPFMRPVAEAVSKMRFLGLTGLTLIFTLVVGGGEALKISIIVFGMTVYALTAMTNVVATIPRAKFDHARTLRMGEWRAVWEVVVLGRRADAFEVMRQNAAIGWMMLTMVEGLVRSGGGIGSLLLTQNKYFNLSAVFAIQLLILVVGLIVDYLIGVAKNLACPYDQLTMERK
jgi:NitT/TauT family transport system permease protein